MDLSRRGHKELEQKHLDDKAIEELDLSYNALETLPDWLAEFRKLKKIDLSNNCFSTFPEVLLQLPTLEFVFLGENQIQTLPEEIRRMSTLRSLNLRGNKLESLPRGLEKTQIKNFNLQNNQLGEARKWYLPSSLETLILDGNRLKAAPLCIGSLPLLQDLYINQNPLTFPPDEISTRGNASILHYMREIHGGSRPLNMAQLLVLGDPGAGKTTLSRALSGETFEPSYQATRGVDILKSSLTGAGSAVYDLSIWDFEGQEINLQTHQFFMRSKGFYLLVFKNNGQSLETRIDHWLNMIQQRVPNVQVLIVFTACEKGRPTFDEERLKTSRFKDLLPEDFVHYVGCENERGLVGLRRRLAGLIAQSEHFPQLWPNAFIKALIYLRTQNQDSFMGRDALEAILKQHGVPEPLYDDATALMSSAGFITHFPQSRKLRNFIVLDPNRLTRILSNLLESETLIKSRGFVGMGNLVVLGRMNVEAREYSQFWNDICQVMVEYEMIYPHPQNNSKYLVPLRFPSQKPALPWTLAQKSARVAEYHFDYALPPGVMSRLIVKLHPYIVSNPRRPEGVFWRNGLFARIPTWSSFSEVLCQQMPNRRCLRVEVRSPWPQNALQWIDDHLNAIFELFPGLVCNRVVGCLLEDGVYCKGLHTARRVSMALEQDYDIPCEACEQLVPAQRLVKGFTRSFFEPVSSNPVGVLSQVSELGAYLNENPHTFPETVLHQMQQCQNDLFHLLRKDVPAALPCLFTLKPVDEGTEPWYEKAYRPSFYCEYETTPHNVVSLGLIKPERDQWLSLEPLLRVVSSFLELAHQFYSDYFFGAFTQHPQEDSQLGLNWTQVCEEIRFTRDLADKIGFELGPALPEPTNQALGDASEVFTELVDPRSVYQSGASTDAPSVKVGDDGFMGRFERGDGQSCWLCDVHWPNGKKVGL